MKFDRWTRRVAMLLAAMAVTLSGCTSYVTTQVTAFSDWSGNDATRTYAFTRASDQQNNLAEMASLDIPRDTKTATRSFVLPADVASELDDAVAEPKVVRKGARPKTADAQQADSSSRTEPKLTKNLIAQWALSKGRVEIMARPVKAPRFVSQSLRKQPTEVYAEGFQANAVQIDPARFSGTAVNFMPVKKFSETN